MSGRGLHRSPSFNEPTLPPDVRQASLSQPAGQGCSAERPEHSLLLEDLASARHEPRKCTLVDGMDPEEMRIEVLDRQKSPGPQHPRELAHALTELSFRQVLHHVRGPDGVEAGLL